jgi:hypothetical protein
LAVARVLLCFLYGYEQASRISFVR